MWSRSFDLLLTTSPATKSQKKTTYFAEKTREYFRLFFPYNLKRNKCNINHLNIKALVGRVSNGALSEWEKVTAIGTMSFLVMRRDSQTVLLLIEAFYLFPLQWVKTCTH